MPRALLAIVALAAVAVLLAGCGGKSAAPGVADIGSTTTGTTTNQSSADAGANAGPSAAPSGGSGGAVRLQLAGSGKTIAQFASCMRKNGEPNFPDPNAQGQLSIDSSSGIDPSSARFQSAQRACAKYLPNGGQPPSPAQQAKMQAQALEFSACMRAHGVPNFPDPQFGGGHISIRIGVGSGIDPRSTQFQAAQQACASDLPGKAGPVPAGSAGKATVGQGSVAGGR
jgi:hypothetical protein